MTSTPQSSSFAIARGNQLVGYKAGLALQSHIEAAHFGKIDANCQACKEIQLKVCAAQVGGE